ncbi:hypothetical protein J4Q44_G00118990 [Coregonus suidteri]|uniref:P2X purinoreceptor 7 intracellular domain-containing protein n=1 Tax=Coregonus suidteri TaxID=861788 RepID=A0AAN8LWE4_9TELE
MRTELGWRLTPQSMVETQAMVAELSEEEIWGLLEAIMDPGMVFDLLWMRQSRNGRPGEEQAAVAPGLPLWCHCGRCKDMPTDMERKCSGQGLAQCVSLAPHLFLYVLENGVLRIARRYRNDVLSLSYTGDPRYDHREYQHDTYRHFVQLNLK